MKIEVHGWVVFGGAGGCADLSPRMMPLGWAGGCQMSLTEEVLTSGNRMPTGGPGTMGDRYVRQQYIMNPTIILQKVSVYVCVGVCVSVYVCVCASVVTVVQGPLQDGGGAGSAIADACEG